MSVTERAAAAACFLMMLSRLRGSALGNSSSCVKCVGGTSFTSKPSHSSPASAGCVLGVVNKEGEGEGGAMAMELSWIPRVGLRGSGD